MGIEPAFDDLNPVEVAAHGVAQDDSTQRIGGVLTTWATATLRFESVI